MQNLLCSKNTSGVFFFLGCITVVNVIKSLLVLRFLFGQELETVTYARPPVGVDSMPHSFVPLRILKKPLLPQLEPQLLATVQ